MDEYFKDFVVIQPDSTIVAIDYVIAKARPSEEVVRYLVWYLLLNTKTLNTWALTRFLCTWLMTYFSKEQIINTTPSVLKSLQDQGKPNKTNMIGELHQT